MTSKLTDTIKELYQSAKRQVSKAALITLGAATLASCNPLDYETGKYDVVLSSGRHVTARVEHKDNFLGTDKDITTVMDGKNTYVFTESFRQDGRKKEERLDIKGAGEKVVLHNDKPYNNILERVDIGGRTFNYEDVTDPRVKQALLEQRDYFDSTKREMLRTKDKVTDLYTKGVIHQMRDQLKPLLK